MVQTAQWVRDLHALTLEALKDKYGIKAPKDERSQKQLQRYYGNSEKTMERPAPENTGKLISTWEMMSKNADGEQEVTTLHKYEYEGVAAVESYEPVEAAKITPTRRRAIRRLAKYVLVYGDGQVDYRRIIDPVTDNQELQPLHDIAMHKVIQQINAKYQPETTVNLGDFADMSALSRFSPDSDHFHKTLGPSMRYIHDFYAQMVADNPKAKHVEVDSNHAVRPKKQVLNNLPALHDFVRPGEDYPMMTYYYFANLGKLGIHFVSGYGAAEYVYGEENGNPIVFKHGNHSSSAPGATVRKESSENPSVNIVRGHGHHDEEVRRTTREGRQLFYKMLGSSCLNNGIVPGYSSAVDDFNRPVAQQINHQNTIGLIEDYGNGRYQLNTIDVVGGVAYYDGEEFNGNENL